MLNEVEEKKIKILASAVAAIDKTEKMNDANLTYDTKSFDNIVIHTTKPVCNPKTIFIYVNCQQFICQYRFDSLQFEACQIFAIAHLIII